MTGRGDPDERLGLFNESEDDVDRQLELLISQRQRPQQPHMGGLHILPTSTEINPQQPNNCSLHQLPLPITSPRPMRETLNITRASKQYVYDSAEVQYLDTVNGTSHVGHCHPQVVAAGNNQMARLVTSQGFSSDILSKYISQLVSTFPEPLSVCYLTNSGSEANDLAMRLAKSYTGKEDFVVTEDAYHGNIGALIDISPKMHHRVKNYKKKDHVHIAKLPDMFRGKFRSEEVDGDPGLLYAKEVENKIIRAEAQGRGVAAYFGEPFFVIPGIFVPPVSYYKHLYKVVRQHGGLIIADEVQSGLGRTGTNMWGFMEYGLVPDIVTVGKGLGNGYPMGAVICSQDISNKLGGYFSTFGGNPVSCAIGLCVLDIVRNEKLQSSARMVGKHLQNELRNLQEKFDCIGDVRGCGLLQAMEIVNNRRDRIPAAALTAEIMYGMKTKNIIIQVTGRNQNVILITPPMCFNIENSRKFAETLEEVLNMLGLNQQRENSPDYEPIKIDRGERKRVNISRPDPEDSEPGPKYNASEMEYDSLCDMD